MNDPEYYYNMMLKYAELKENSVLEVNKYKKIVSLLFNLKSKFEKISETLEDAEGNYLQGGFLSDNKTFDDGDLKYCYDNLRANDNNIKHIILGYQCMIKEKNENIELYDSKYFFAKKIYNELINNIGTES